MNDYSVGLDLGTHSVGWCVIDQDSNLKRFKKQSMHGVRKVDPANTAEERRLYRSTRRRNERYKYRIRLFQEIMQPMLADIDPGFLIRMSDSFLSEGNHNTYNLFIDKSYSDKLFYNNYPTIYHLRHHLLTTENKMDIRFVYLAIHHILKNRGHFLYEGQQLQVSSSEVIQGSLGSLFGQDCDVIEISNVLSKANIDRMKKRDLLKMVLIDPTSSKENQNKIEGYISGILGYAINLKKTFGDKNYDKSSYTIGNIFNEEDTTIFDNLANVLSIDDIDILSDINDVYSWTLMQEVLSGKQSVSEAKIELYDTHKKQLNITKEFLRKYDKEGFAEIFKSSNKVSYEMYIRQTGKCSLEDLNKNN